MPKNQIFDSRIYSDYNFLLALKKLTKVSVPKNVRSCEDAIWYYTKEGILNLPIDASTNNLLVVHELIQPVVSFVNAAITLKFSGKFFDVVDSMSTQPEDIFILPDTSFKPPNNLMVYTPSTNLKRHVIPSSGALVMSLTNPDNSDSPVAYRQMASLRSFLCANEPYEIIE